jgi:Bacterial Ig-like domain/Carboxypeptidase regulatory-like domain
MTSHRATRLRRPAPLAARLGVALLLTGLAPFAGNVQAVTTGRDVQLPVGHQIRGLVESPEGDPLAGSQVDVTDDQSVFLSAVTAADGTYTVHGVPDGQFRVHASTQDDAFLMAYYGVPDSTPDYDAATLVSVTGSDATGIDIRLIAPAPTGISGTIRDPDGAPVAGIEILANGPTGGASTSAADGTYRIPRLPSGDYALFVQPPDSSPFLYGPYVDGAVGEPEEDGTMVTVADGDTTGVDITLARGGSIHGRVTSARPAAIKVFASGPSGKSVLAASDGSYTIQGLRSGEYQLQFGDVIPGPEQTETGNFSYGFYGPAGTMVDQAHALAVPVGTGTAELPLARIKRGTDIVGSVTDGRNPIAGAFLFVCDVGGSLGCASATSAANGSFRVIHVPTGQFTIQAAAPGRVAGYYVKGGFTIDDAAAGTVSVVSGKPDVTGILIEPPAGGTVSGRITGPSGEPIPGASVTVFPFGTGPGQPIPTTDATGRFRQTGIPTNQYGLDVRAPAGSDYLSGYYVVGAPGNYGSDFSLATTFRVIEGHDRAAPTITSRDPAPGATSVFPGTAISVRFSEPVDGINETSVSLRDPKGKLVPASVTFEAQYRTATLTPIDPLEPGVRYRVTITNAVVDWSGNRFVKSSWVFDTAS